MRGSRTTKVADGDSGQIVERCQQVLAQVIGADANTWPTLEQWRTALPPWFLGSFATEQSIEEASAWVAWWRGLDREEQIRAESARGWTLSDWLYWLEPVNRTWHWWNGRVLDANTAVIELMITDWPTPVGSLKWLVRAAGGRDIVFE